MRNVLLGSLKAMWFSNMFCSMKDHGAMALRQNVVKGLTIVAKKEVGVDVSVGCVYPEVIPKKALEKIDSYLYSELAKVDFDFVCRQVLSGAWDRVIGVYAKNLVSGVDDLIPVLRSCEVIIYQIMIYDRWGLICELLSTEQSYETIYGVVDISHADFMKAYKKVT